jgi:hypothetical protein
MHPGHPLQPCLTTLTDLGYRQRVTYIPAASFWPLQLTETAIYLLATLTLSAVCLVAIKRRLT